MLIKFIRYIWLIKLFYTICSLNKHKIVLDLIPNKTSHLNFILCIIIFHSPLFLFFNLYEFWNLTFNVQDGKPATNASLTGGESEALNRLKKFAAECQAQTAEKNKDSIFGANFSCKISPWLATGCLSPRFMFDELKKNGSRYILLSSVSYSADCVVISSLILLWDCS